MHRPAVARHDVILLLEPFHDLGRAVCRRLALEGVRPVAVSDDPTAGEAFSTRMAVEGFTVPHRTVHIDFADCEKRLAGDLKRVYGGLRGMLSFFEPLHTRREWLKFPLTAADAVLRRSMNRRLRMLQAIAPLLANRGFLQDVVMGVADHGGNPAMAVDSMSARLWDDLLAPEWERHGVLMRRTYTRFTVDRDWADLTVDVERVLEDFKRCLKQTRLRGARAKAS